MAFNLTCVLPSPSPKFSISIFNKINSSTIFGFNVLFFISVDTISSILSIRRLELVIKSFFFLNIKLEIFLNSSWFSKKSILENDFKIFSFKKIDRSSFFFNVNNFFSVSLFFAFFERFKIELR